MAEPLLLSSGKRELVIDPPLMNAAGTLGFGTEASGWVALDHLGAFVTNPLSRRRRSPAADAGVLATPAGFLLHNGLPNPGLTAGLRLPSPGADRLPRIVHLIGNPAAELERMILAAESHEQVAAIEIGLEQPDPSLLKAVGHLVRGAELPVILRLGLDEADESFVRAAEAGCHALSFGPARGSLAQGAGMFRGRLYGPAVFPLALAKLERLRPQVDCQLIAAGGITHRQAAHTLLDAGADALQLDSILWLDPKEVLPL